MHAHATPFLTSHNSLGKPAPPPGTDQPLAIQKFQMTSKYALIVAGERKAFVAECSDKIAQLFSYREWLRNVNHAQKLSNRLNPAEYIQRLFMQLPGYT